MPNQTGPKTPEGKARSSMNALKHGLTAKAPHVIKAVAEQLNIDFVPFYEEVARYYHPCDPVEEQLVNRIARCMWRLARAEVMESRLLDRNPGALKPGLSIQKVMEYERITDLQLHRAIRAFERKRSRRY